MMVHHLITTVAAAVFGMFIGVAVEEFNYRHGYYSSVGGFWQRMGGSKGMAILGAALLAGGVISFILVHLVAVPTIEDIFNA